MPASRSWRKIAEDRWDTNEHCHRHSSNHRRRRSAERLAASISATHTLSGGMSTSPEEFAVYGLPGWFRYVVGTPKVGSALCLIAGLWLRFLVFPSALLIAILMLGPLAMHVKDSRSAEEVGACARHAGVQCHHLPGLDALTNAMKVPTYIIAGIAQAISIVSFAWYGMRCFVSAAMVTEFERPASSFSLAHGHVAGGREPGIARGLLFPPGAPAFRRRFGGDDVAPGAWTSEHSGSSSRGDPRHRISCLECLHRRGCSMSTVDR